MTDLPKQYDHLAAQKKWYAFWEERGYFHSEPDPEGKKHPKGPYTIVIPPPNVTGALHLGHALNNTLQDILIRMKRMQGFNTLWMPGTDHAGIATQAVVERRLLEEEGKTRHDLGREKLVERIWKWKHEYEARILGQLKQMGCSCDWQRTRFTLDDVCARAVRQTFFNFFKAGLIYRGKRLVNWDTFLQTAVSDDEVFHETVQGHFWHIRYPVIDPQPGEPTHVTVATTRPETMLGDTAVAVHPDPATALDHLGMELSVRLEKANDKERAEIHAQMESLARRREEMLPLLCTLRDMARDGRMVMLPLLDRPIPLICDEWAKPELGSGCVKITPAHDPNDYEVWQRNEEIGAINILNPDGTLNENAGTYAGLSMADARKRVAADLEARGLLEKVEDREIELAHSDRSKTPIEPYLADQWFMKMGDEEEDPLTLTLSPEDGGEGTRIGGDHERHEGHEEGGKPGLAQSAMDAVTSGRVKIFPERYAKGYLDWLGEKRDWCIGRALWWGHQIPVWTREFKLRELMNSRNDQFLTALFAITHASSVVTVEEINGARRWNDIDQPESSGWTELRELASQEPNRDVRVYICPAPYVPMSAAQKLQLVQGLQRAGLPASVEDEFDPPHIRDREKVYAEEAGFVQDSAVLDTWFSSALWPHSTLGWPEQTPELAYYYPTSTLVTSRDIITLWVARMVLSGQFNCGDVPFRQVYITTKILDAYGETMSKSKGNGIDPLDIIEKSGADALRFALAHLSTNSQDARMPAEFECPHCQGKVEMTRENRMRPRVKCTNKPCGKEFSTQWASKPEDKALPRAFVVSEKFELGRNFCNKLWNAARFALMNLEGFTPAEVRDDELAIEDRWVHSRLATVTREVTDALEQFGFAEAARSLYDFAWDEFCSFYVEMAKYRLASEATRPVAQRVLAHVLDVLLRLLHPMIPFLTEEVWQLLNAAAPRRGMTSLEEPAESIMIAAWPEADLSHQDRQIESQFAVFQAVLRGVRDIRARQGIAPKQPLEFVARCDEATAAQLAPLSPYFQTMAAATLRDLGPAITPPKPSATFTAAGVEVFVDLAGHIDVAAEVAKNEKERANLRGLIESKEKKLSNESFVARAPADVVVKERASLAELRERLAAVELFLAEMDGAK